MPEVQVLLLYAKALKSAIHKAPKTSAPFSSLTSLSRIWNFLCETGKAVVILTLRMPPEDAAEQLKKVYNEVVEDRLPNFASHIPLLPETEDLSCTVRRLVGCTRRYLLNELMTNSNPEVFGDSHVQFVSKIRRKSTFFHPSFPRQKIRPVSGEFSTFGVAKKVAYQTTYVNFTFCPLAITF
jgi:hypothetical protein